MEVPGQILVEADLFVSYLTGDDLHGNFSRIVAMAEDGETQLLCSSEVYDDVLSALRSQNLDLEQILDFVWDMRAVPHRAIAMTAETARMALELYRDHGGSRKLHYFDSFHVATSMQSSLELLTSDRYILDNARNLGVDVIDVRRL